LKFGLAIPNCGEGLIYPAGLANNKSLVNLSMKAEELGFDSVWGNDHISTQKYLREMPAGPPNFFEPLITHAFIAQATKRIRMGTGIVVLPYRNPVVLAKQVATLDVLSGGRLVLGIGTGAYKEEFEGINPGWKYEDRGTLMDEAIEALRLLLTKPKADYEGKYIQFHDVQMFPKPKQKPLPLWMGGNSPRVLRRAAQMGEGWLPACLTPREVRIGIKRIREHAKKVHRDISRLDVGPQYMVSVASTTEKASGNFKRSLSYKHLVSLRKTTLKGQSPDSYQQANLIDTPTKVIEHIDALDRAGVTYLPALIFMAETYDGIVEQATRFASEVMPSF
jgi:probable F420-dependent oxidoreductase